MRDNKEGVGEGTTLHVCRKYYGTFMHCKRRRREDQSETRNMVHMASIRRSGMPHIGLRVKMSWMSLIVRVASIGGPGRMLRRCFVVFNICWTLGKTRAT